MKTNNEVMNQVMASMLTEDEARLGIVYPKDSKMAVGVIAFDDEGVANNKKILRMIENQYLAIKKAVMLSELGKELNAKWIEE